MRRPYLGALLLLAALARPDGRVRSCFGPLAYGFAGAHHFG